MTVVAVLVAWLRSNLLSFFSNGPAPIGDDGIVGLERNDLVREESLVEHFMHLLGLCEILVVDV